MHKSYIFLFILYTIINGLSTIVYYLAFVMAAFSTDSAGVTVLFFLILIVPPIIINGLILLVTLFIKRISISKKNKCIFAVIYTFLILLLLFIYVSIVAF